MPRKTVPEIKAQKNKEPLIVLTCYTAPMAKILDKYVDILLVGDSLGMVVYGMESTLPVTLDMMINHGRAVVRASANALVVVDMPFGSYQPSRKTAFESAARIMRETGCQAVKFEGGLEMRETVRHLVERGIPVMGHIGLLPQSVNSTGGYKFQGRTEEERKKLKMDALALQQAGAFSIVIEAVAEKAAREITKALKIPTIGIGASTKCDGQVLVVDDMLGLSPITPKFVKKFGDLVEGIEKAAASYARAVKSRQFPGKGNLY